jgi:hypothetical protein
MTWCKATDLNNCELDRVGNEWTLTCFLSTGAPALRIKFQMLFDRDAYYEPTPFVGEVRLARCAPFVAVGRFSVSVADIISWSGEEYTWCALPHVFNAEFRQMLQLWARISELAAFGRTDHVRYRPAPHDAHDMYQVLL